jgi:CHASE2 domain-containing sensor protein
MLAQYATIFLVSLILALLSWSGVADSLPATMRMTIHDKRRRLLIPSLAVITASVVCIILLLAGIDYPIDAILELL